MSRPPLPIGAYGNITVKEISPGVWQAYARYRAADGRLVPIKRRAKTKPLAINLVKKAISEAPDLAVGQEISPTTRFQVIAELWLDEIDREARLGDRSPTSVRLYRSHLKNWITDGLGSLRAREVSVGRCDRTVKNAHDKGSADTAKTVRTVLSGICGYGVRHGAWTNNPVRSIGRLVRGVHETNDVRAMTADERADLDSKLRHLAIAKSVDSRGRSLGARAQVWADLPDIKDAMLSTGVRIGELLAITADEVDAEERTVLVAWHLIRVTGQGLVRRPLRKGNKSGLLLRVPAWSVPMWRRRRLAAGTGPLFPAWNGEWQDPSNLIHRVREAFDASGYDWVTSHVFRKTVATVLDEAGLPIGAVADQLGNTRTVAEKHYIARRIANDQTADALDHISADPVI